MKKELIAIEEHTNIVFGESAEGTVTFVKNGEIIPPEQLGYQFAPPDGYYRLSPATCGGLCSVGNPKPKCVKNGLYDQNKCAVYFTYPISEQSVPLDTILKLFCLKDNS